MKTCEARFLSLGIQEELRFRGGREKSAAARNLRCLAQLDRPLAGESRTRQSHPSEFQAARLVQRYSPASPQAATTRHLITDRCPDQVKLPFVLWTREAVPQLLAERSRPERSV